MKFPKVYYIVLVLLLLSLITFGQEERKCCDADFPLVVRDTVLAGPRLLPLYAEAAYDQEIHVTYKKKAPKVVEQAVYSGGGWTHSSNTADPFLSRTCSFSNSVGDFCILNFFGGQIKIITATDKHHGMAGVSINGGDEVMVSLYSASRINNVTVYTSPKEMSYGTNSIKITVTGAKAVPQAIGTYVVLDYFSIIP